MSLIHDSLCRAVLLNCPKLDLQYFHFNSVGVSSLVSLQVSVAFYLFNIFITFVCILIKTKNVLKKNN